MFVQLLTKGWIQLGGDCPRKTYESTKVTILHDILQSGKQHSRYKAIFVVHCFVTEVCEVYFISLTVAKPS